MMDEERDVRLAKILVKYVATSELLLRQSDAFESDYCPNIINRKFL